MIFLQLAFLLSPSLLLSEKIMFDGLLTFWQAGQWVCKQMIRISGLKYFNINIIKYKPFLVFFLYKCFYCFILISGNFTEALYWIIPIAYFFHYYHYALDFTFNNCCCFWVFQKKFLKFIGRLSFKKSSLEFWLKK